MNNHDVDIANGKATSYARLLRRQRPETLVEAISQDNSLQDFFLFFNELLFSGTRRFSRHHARKMFSQFGGFK